MRSVQKSVLLVLTFVLSFMASYGVVQMVRTGIASRYEAVDQEEIKIIQEEIKERFDLFLDVSLVIGQMSARYLTDKKFEDAQYGELVSEILAEKDYFLGLNRLDPAGNITSVYPPESNQAAKGKVTQNIQELKNSVERGEKFWLSPPFRLYQGAIGFVIYVPIFDKNKFQGWIAPVTNSQIFFERFRALDFFKTYELVIKDEFTGAVYFATAGEPEKGEHSYVVRTKSKGRGIVLQSWRKKEKQLLFFPWYWGHLFALIMGLLFTFLVKQFLSRREAIARLDNVSKLLRLTSKEALNNLIDIQSEYISLGSTGYLRTKVVEKDVVSITNLVEQIDLLQSMAESDEVEEEEFLILPKLKELLEDMSDFIERKDLRIELDEASLKETLTRGNLWLFKNTTLKNSLIHCVIFSRPSKKIRISMEASGPKRSLFFHCEDVVDNESHDAFKIERRLLVAKKAMDLMKGDLSLIKAEGEGLILRLTLSP